MNTFEYDTNTLQQIAHREAEGWMGRIKVKELENIYHLYEEGMNEHDKDYRSLYTLAVKYNKLYDYYYNKYSSNSMNLFEKMAFKVSFVVVNDTRN